MKLRRFRYWFLAAAIYNVLWGVFTIVSPNTLFDLFGMARPNYPALFRCIGMMVMVFSIGYYLVYKDPLRYGALIWIGLLGKLFGIVGFFFSVAAGELPWSFGWVVVTNDAIWLPPFVVFLYMRMNLATD